MIDIEDILLYSMVTGVVAITSKGLEQLGKNKIAKTLDIIFFGGSIILLIKQLDKISVKVSDFL